MNLSFIEKTKIKEYLSMQDANSLEFVFIATGALEKNSTKENFSLLDNATRVLKNGGLLFIQGIPQALPELGVFLDKVLKFKYWFAIESLPVEKPHLNSVHAAVMLFVKGNGRFNIQSVRLPHQKCKACERTLKDWGGKSHLMNPEGYAISDVIKDIPVANNYNQVSKPLFDLFMEMIHFASKKSKQKDKLIEASVPEISGIAVPLEAFAWKNKKVSENNAQYLLPKFEFLKPKLIKRDSQKKPSFSGELFNVIHQGDAIEILKEYPDESIDLVFADPPYNLDKDYSVYDDEKPEEKYINWCNEWLSEYARVLKPTGSLYVLNLPHWSLHHAHFLNQHLHFQNWIVWDALSAPRGKIMPAHYSLLFYTKSQNDFTFNPVKEIDARHYCLRSSCIRERKKTGGDDKVTLNDIWWDIHRIKHRRDRDHHPCQLPEPFMSRLIQMSTNRGDIVLDAFGGAGTTPITALQLGRGYVAIDLDPNYVEIMKNKIAQLQNSGEINRESIKKASLLVPKKTLQLELRHLAKELGRLPTQEDVKEKSQYDLNIFLETFPSWGKALKAAKLEVQLQ